MTLRKGRGFYVPQAGGDPPGSVPEQRSDPRGTREDESAALRKNSATVELPKTNLLRFFLWPLENVSLPTAEDDALDRATDERGSEIDVQIFPWLLWPSARIVPV